MTLKIRKWDKYVLFFIYILMGLKFLNAKEKVKNVNKKNPKYY